MIVINTHALVWFIQSDAKLGSAARAEIEAACERDATLIPAMCVWKLAHMERRRAILLPAEANIWIERVLDRYGFTIAPLEPAIAIRSVRLNWAHKDPVDRIIVATAREYAVPVITGGC